MRRILSAFAAGVALVPALAFAGGQDQTPPPLPGWHESVPAGFAEARSQGRPVLIVFR